jgi:protein-disulfide isomerase
MRAEHLAHCAALAALAVAAWLTPAPSLAQPPTAGDAPPGAPEAIATIGDRNLTERDVIAANSGAFENLERERAERQSALDHEHARDYHQLLESSLAAELDKQVLAQEAAARRVSTSALLAEIKAPVVTDEETRAFYEERKSVTNESFAQLEPQIRQYLALQHDETAKQAFYADLRRKYRVVSMLTAYRVAVEPAGPARGKAAARVTIVEFADFQCPYCRQVQGSLQKVLAKHPDDVRLVFRNLPLSNVHPHAVLAARAGVCADHQGKFWDMHDAMFQDQTALGAEQLKQTAQRLGLDRQRFSSCLDDAASAEAVLHADEQAAAGLGIGETPYFLIDGRPYAGNLSADQIEKIVADELGRGAQGS